MVKIGNIFGAKYQAKAQMAGGGIASHSSRTNKVNGTVHTSQCQIIIGKIIRPGNKINIKLCVYFFRQNSTESADNGAASADSSASSGDTASSDDPWANVDTSEHVVITYMTTGDTPSGTKEKYDEMMTQLNAIPALSFNHIRH